uniref:Uncharacterized protein n=1 Tax=Photinus pyralis TaxID=7054 RepID=A0A1Y1MRM0_PHOPY
MNAKRRVLHNAVQILTSAGSSTTQSGNIHRDRQNGYVQGVLGHFLKRKTKEQLNLFRFGDATALILKIKTFYFGNVYISQCASKACKPFTTNVRHSFTCCEIDCLKDYPNA